MESFNNPIIKKVQEENIPYKDANASKIRRVVREAAKENGVKILGTGFTESIVFEAEDPNKVIALRHRPNLLFEKVSGYNKPETFTKTQFYMHQILHTLFPDSFPKIHSAFINPGDETHGAVSGTVREKVIKGKQPKLPIYNLNRTVYDEYADADFDYEDEPTEDEKLVDIENKKFRNLIETLERLGIHVILDPHGKNNFVFDENRSLKYLDTTDTCSISRNASKKVLEYMQQESYSPAQIHTVQNALTRIKELRKEDGKKENKS